MPVLDNVYKAGMLVDMITPVTRETAELSATTNPKISGLLAGISSNGNLAYKLSNGLDTYHRGKESEVNHSASDNNYYVMHGNYTRNEHIITEGPYDISKVYDTIKSIPNDSSNDYRVIQSSNTEYINLARNAYDLEYNMSKAAFEGDTYKLSEDELKLDELLKNQNRNVYAGTMLGAFIGVAVTGLIFTGIMLARNNSSNYRDMEKAKRLADNRKLLLLGTAIAIGIGTISSIAGYYITKYRDVKRMKEILRRIEEK